jgi:hypothetical protein
MTVASVDFSRKPVLDRKTHLTGTVARVWKLIGFEPPEPDPDWKISPVVCVDSFIVPIPRPTGWDAQKPFFLTIRRT